MNDQENFGWRDLALMALLLCGVIAFAFGMLEWVLRLSHDCEVAPLNAHLEGQETSFFTVKKMECRP